MTDGNGCMESWDSIIGKPAEGHARRRVWRIITAILGYAMLLAGTSCFVFVMAGLAKAALPGDPQAAAVVDEWPDDDPRGMAMRRAAEAYNARLKASGQPIIGESTGPDAARIGLSEKTDAAYNSTLNLGAGIIGKVVIPKIGVDMVIRHGSSNGILDVGAGHVYGTSMPVGGPGTHAVIAAHRGGRERMMFLRLDEMRAGDMFYIKTLGHTLGYKVTDIRVVEPDEVSSLRAVDGADQVTLLTCTPFNVNTQRLLVTGIRVPVPPGDLSGARMKGDPTTAGIAVAAMTLVSLLALLAVAKGLAGREGRRMHMTGMKIALGRHGPKTAV